MPAMLVITDGAALPDTMIGAVFAIGNFDGVHRGHRAVIAEAQAIAQAQGRRVGVLTFEPHPRSFFQPDKPLFRLTSPERKRALLLELGLDVVVIQAFDASLARLTPEAFVADILVGRLHAAHVVAGDDFHFGRGRAGTPALLKSLAASHGLGCTLVGPVGDGVERYSSSRVRHALKACDVTEAAHVLGRFWRAEGVVVAGDARGGVMGFPTANIALSPGQELGHGIYAARVRIGDRTYWGAAYMGERPTFDGEGARLETFIFDFAGDLYGQTIAVDLLAFIRPDQKFASMEALVAQMSRDVAEAQRICADIGDATAPIRDAAAAIPQAS